MKTKPLYVKVMDLFQDTFEILDSNNNGETSLQIIESSIDFEHTQMLLKLTFENSKNTNKNEIEIILDVNVYWEGGQILIDNSKSKLGNLKWDYVENSCISYLFEFENFVEFKKFLIHNKKRFDNE